MSPVWEMNADSFFDFCQLNSHLRIERNATGKLIIMSPVGSETGNRNAKLMQQLANWTDRDGSGIEFDSSAGFILPSGATRSPRSLASSRTSFWDERSSSRAGFS